MVVAVAGVSFGRYPCVLHIFILGNQQVTVVFKAVEKHLL